MVFKAFNGRIEKFPLFRIKNFPFLNLEARHWGNSSAVRFGAIDPPSLDDKIFLGISTVNQS